MSSTSANTDFQLCASSRTPMAPEAAVRTSEVRRVPQRPRPLAASLPKPPWASDARSPEFGRLDAGNVALGHEEWNEKWDAATRAVKEMAENLQFVHDDSADDDDSADASYRPHPSLMAEWDRQVQAVQEAAKLAVQAADGNMKAGTDDCEDSDADDDDDESFMDGDLESVNSSQEDASHMEFVSLGEICDIKFTREVRGDVSLDESSDDSECPHQALH